MKRLDPHKLHVRFLGDAGELQSVAPRCYTLTHSDRTGHLYLTVASCHAREQISGWYTRFMRDEVLADWDDGDGHPALHVHCHVSGGFAFGTAGLRNAIFQRELPLVLEAIRYGDRAFFDAHPHMDDAPISVHFHARQARYDRIEGWGTPSQYR